MKSINIALLAFVLSLISVNAYSAFNTYQFDDPIKKQRFDKLINELRCTVCQNQTIAGSNADLAKDLRDKVYKMVNEGKTEQEIKDFMVDRFTDFVLYNPPLKESTYLLWWGPFFLLVFAVIMLIVQIRKRTQAPSIDINPQQHERIQQLLKTEQKDNNND